MFGNLLAEKLVSISSLANQIQELKTRSKQDPFRWFVPTRPQKRFIDDPTPIKLLLGGNQTGKTAACAYLLVAHCLGRHPTLKTDPPPVECWLITYSHEQSRTIQQKLYDMIPKDELTDDCEFIRGRGFRGLAPVVRFRNGSLIRVKTCNQKLGLASGSCSLICIDEPVSWDVFNELLARTLRGGTGGKRGTLAITMTPVGQVDVSYIEDMVNNNQISCTRSTLSVKDTTPIGLQPILTKEQIQGITDAFLPIDREARINGSFSVAPVGVIFDTFEDSMISDRPVASGGEYKFSVGIDHGSLPNSQVALLSCIDMKDPKQPRVYVLDEYVSGKATPEVHAKGILDMLNRNGIAPMQCRFTGDTDHNGRAGYKMSNLALIRGFESVLNLPHKGLPFRIHRAIKKRHSVYFSASMLHAIMSRNHFQINPRCTKTIKSIKNWTMKREQYNRSRDKFGHCIDALRYAIMPIIDFKVNTGFARIEIR